MARGDTARVIAQELRALDDTLLFSAATSGLDKGVQTGPHALPMSARLSQYSQLKTVKTSGLTGSRAAHVSTINELGVTLAAGADDALPLDATTGRVALDAEVQRLERSGAIQSPAQQRAAAKAMTTRDTVAIYLNMQDTANFATEYRGKFQFTQEMRDKIGHMDKSNVGIFKLDEYRVYVEAANKYNAWPPQSGVPPWPARKV